PKTWETKEVAPNGEYTARYTQAGKDADGLRKVKKRTLGYAEDAPSEGPHEITVKRFIKPHGELIAVFDVAKGRLAGIHGNAGEEVLLNGRAVGITNVKLKLSL